MGIKKKNCSDFKLERIPIKLPKIIRCFSTMYTYPIYTKLINNNMSISDSSPFKKYEDDIRNQFFDIRNIKYLDLEIKYKNILLNILKIIKIYKKLKIIKKIDILCNKYYNIINCKKKIILYIL